MIHIRTNEEIELIRKSALMVSATLTEVAKFLKEPPNEINSKRKKVLKLKKNIFL